MNRRAANALRCLAVLAILQTLATVGVGLLQDAAFAKLRDPGDSGVDSHEVIEHLQSLMTASWYAHLGLAVAVVACLVVLAMSIERGRALANVAIALWLVHLGFSVYQHLEPSTAPVVVIKVMWILSGAVFGVATMLPLVAGARAVPGWKHAGLAVGVGIAVMVVPTVIDAFLILAELSSPATQWLYRGLDVVATGWFVGFGVALARALQHGAPIAAPEPAGTGLALDGAPLRVIGWAILFRIAIGVAVAIASIVAGMHDSYGSLAAAAIGSTVVAAITAFFVIGGLVGYAKYPAAHRSDGLYLVIGLIVVGVILDIVVAKSTSSLLGLLGQAQHADSMWSMPSISDMESMQATVVWGGRASLVAGVVSVLVLLGSLTTTARAAGAEELAGTSSVAGGLVVVAAVGALVIGAWMPHARSKDEGVLLVAALVVLVVAVIALVSMLRVLFGVARAVEAPAAAA